MTFSTNYWYCSLLVTYSPLAGWIFTFGSIGVSIALHHSKPVCPSKSRTYLCWKNLSNSKPRKYFKLPKSLISNFWALIFLTSLAHCYHQLWELYIHMDNNNSHFTSTLVYIEHSMIGLTIAIVVTLYYPKHWKQARGDCLSLCKDFF